MERSDGFLNDERNQPRSFTGLTDEEWARFSTIVAAHVGRKKRSLFLSIAVKKVIENAQAGLVRQAGIDRVATHAINDAAKFVGARDLFREWQ